MTKDKTVKPKKVIIPKEEIIEEVKTPEATVEEKKQIQVIERIIENKEIRMLVK